MNLPFPIFTAGLLFWGWQTMQWQAALVMVLLLEGSRFLSWRWQAEDKDFYRVADLGTLILVGLLLYPHITGVRETPAVIYELQIIPYALFPLMLGQVYSTSQSFPLSGLFYTLRRKGNIQRIPLDYFFIGGCLTSASASVFRSPWYGPLVVVFVLVLLWFHRPRRYKVYQWLTAALLAVLIGFFQQQGMVVLQREVGDKVAELLIQWFNPEVDPFHRSTALGEIGPLKLSETILFRVDQPHPWTVPLLLRESSYNTFLGKTWLGNKNRLHEVPLSTKVGWWPLHGQDQQGAAIVVDRSFSSGSFMIAAPQGTTLLDGLPAVTMEVNAMGAIKVKQPPSFASIKINYDPKKSFDRPPEEEDLIVSVREQAAVGKIVEELGLVGLPVGEILSRLERFFVDGFRYTVNLDGSTAGESPISRFLLESRAGHCEFFATATVLLLRQAGIPARYVFGYSVHEAEGKVRVVRKRHAHAWASAYINGVWRDVDNTPPDWHGMEEASAVWWSLVTDLWSRITYEIQKWRTSQMEERVMWPWLVVLALLTGFLAWRTVRGKGVRGGEKGGKTSGEEEILAFQKVEEALHSQGWPRLPGEPLGIWLKRVKRLELLPLLALHYRHRYDPLGLSAAEQGELARQVDNWLKEQASNGLE